MNKETKEQNKYIKKFMRRPMWYKVIMAIAAISVVVLLVLIAYAYRLINLVNYEDGSGSIISETDYFDTVENPEDYTHLPTVDDDKEWNKTDGKGRREDGVYNILLLGLDKNSGNLSDANIIVTINQKEKSIKLTSFMRDILVQIPGYSNNKLNTAYGKGGIQLVYDVFATNFDIHLDGYVAVNFSSLTKVIERLGGVSMYISPAEAEYLNTSNYIDDVNSRNLVSGTQTLNGSQAVGYSRIRYLGNDDFERTERQRKLLNAIYEKFRNSSITKLLSLMEDVLPLVTTDLDKVEMIKIATETLNAGLSDLEQFRIPTNNSFTNSWYNKMLVLDLDFNRNIEEFHDFIFGDRE